MPPGCHSCSLAGQHEWHRGGPWGVAGAPTVPPGSTAEQRDRGLRPAASRSLVSFGVSTLLRSGPAREQAQKPKGFSAPNHVKYPFPLTSSTPSAAPPLEELRLFPVQMHLTIQTLNYTSQEAQIKSEGAQILPCLPLFLPGNPPDLMAFIWADTGREGTEQDIRVSRLLGAITSVRFTPCGCRTHGISFQGNGDETCHT